MQYLYFTDNCEVEEIQSSGIKIHDGLNYKDRGVFFVPNLELDYIGPDSKFHGNEFGLHSTLYFWSLIYRKNNEPNGLGDSIVKFELHPENFPIVAYVELNKKTAYDLSEKLESEAYKGIIYDSKKSLKSTLAGIHNHNNFVIEAKFKMSDQVSLNKFFELYLESGGKPWSANSFLLATEKKIEPKCIKEIVEFKKQQGAQ